MGTNAESSVILSSQEGQTLTHKCTLRSPSVGNQKYKSLYARLKNILVKSFYVSEKNPQTREYFRCITEIEEERKRHKEDYGNTVIHPFSSFRLYWELIMIITFIYNVLNTPWDMLFAVIYHEDLGLQSVTIGLTLAALSSLDIYLTFRTGYLDVVQMIVVLDKDTIKRTYWTTGLLFFDIIGTIPIEIIISTILHKTDNSYARFMLVLCITRLFRFPTFNEYLNNAVNLWDINQNIYKSLKYIFFAILIVSWLGAMTTLVSLFAYYYHPQTMHQNWAIQANLHMQLPKFDTVTIIIFRTASNLFGAKHGKYPNIIVEDKLCASISFFIGFFIMAFFMVLMLQMLMDQSIAEISNVQFLNQLQHYMRTIHLPHVLKTKINDFFEYRFRSNTMYDDITMDSLPKSLQKETKMFKYRSVVTKASISSELPMDILELMLDKVEVEYFMTGDIVIKYGDIGKCMYFIVTGTVAIYTRYGVEVCHLFDGAYFGEISLLLDERQTATVIALEPCEMCRLSRKDYNECIARDRVLSESMRAKARERLDATDLLDEMHVSNFTRRQLMQSQLDANAGSHGNLYPTVVDSSMFLNRKMTI